MEAIALIANSHLSKPNCQASLRYMKILREGARLHGVAEPYCKYLDALQPYTPPSIREKIARYVFFVMVIPILLLFIIIFVGGRAIGYKGRMPWVMYWLIDKVSGGLNLFHDYFFSKIFGNGFCCWKEITVTM